MARVPAFVASIICVLGLGCGGGTAGPNPPPPPPPTPPPAPVASLSLNHDTATVTPGAPFQLTATLKDAQGATLTGRPISWASTTPAVASVSTTGLVTAAQMGQSRIIATAEGKSDTTRIAVPAAPVAVTLEAGTAQTVTLGAEGGTIHTTDAHGVGYTLVVPELALRNPVAITMTPLATVTGVPLSGGFVAGVDFKPSGLTFARAATLTVTTSGTPPANRRLVGLTYEGSGTALALTGAKGTANSITVGVTHFSGLFVGFGTAQDIEALWLAINPANNLGSPLAPTTSANAISYIVTVVTTAPTPDAAEWLSLLEVWFDLVILPELQAVSTDAQLAGALVEYDLWYRQLPAILDMYLVIPGGEDHPELVSRRAAWAQVFLVKVKQAIAANNQLCLAPGLASARLTALDNTLFWYRFARHGFGLATAQNGLDLATFRSGLCATSVTQSLTLATPLTGGSAQNLDATFAVRFTDGTIIPANAAVTATATGAALQFPGNTAQSPTGFYSGVVTPAAGAPLVTIDLTACHTGHGSGSIAPDEICHTDHVVRNVVTPLDITAVQLPPLYETSSYFWDLKATGGTGTYQWSLAGGQLPSGLGLNAAGRISGTATTGGNYTFSVTVASGSLTASRSFSILVTPLAHCNGGGRDGAWIFNQDSVAAVAGAVEIAGSLMIFGGGAVTLPSIQCTENQVWIFSPAGSQFPLVTSVDLPALRIIDGNLRVGHPQGGASPLLQSINLPALRSMDGSFQVSQNPVLTSVRAPMLSSWVIGLALVDNPLLTQLEIGPAFINGIFIQRTGLSNLNGLASGITVIGNINLFDNPNLCVAAINAFVARITLFGRVMHNATC